MKIKTFCKKIWTQCCAIEFTSTEPKIHSGDFVFHMTGLLFSFARVQANPLHAHILYVPLLNFLPIIIQTYSHPWIYIRNYSKIRLLYKAIFTISMFNDTSRGIFATWLFVSMGTMYTNLVYEYFHLALWLVVAANYRFHIDTLAQCTFAFSVLNSGWHEIQYQAAKTKMMSWMREDDPEKMDSTFSNILMFGDYRSRHCLFLFARADEYET